MGQNRNQQDQDSPRQSAMEPAEGSRESGRNSESPDSSADRNSSNESEASEDSSSSERGGSNTSGERNSGGGITNRGFDREMAEQEHLPDRGHSQSER